jgi:crotonobetainyl-CoA:carnitine CoA-transferase CaiB-like acyl-CoA transferase
MNEPQENDTREAPVQALAGIRVLDLGTFIAAPFAATIMGEFGAEVVKLERPGSGDPLRGFGTPSRRGDTLCWLSEARNKRSLTLDLSQARGREILLQLVPHFDVVCESFRPGTMERWGLGFEELLQRNPRLVMLRVSGFGQTGPLRERPGFARISHAFGGLAHLTGMPGGPPLTPGSTSLADYISGLYGALGVLMALRVRDQVGGQYIDLALYESIFRVLDDIAGTYAQDGVVRGRLGLGTSNACPHGHFESRDGRWLALACSSDKMFARFAAMIGRPELAAPDRYGRVARRLANRDEVDGITAEWMRAHDAQDIVERCGRAEVPCALVNTIEDIFADAQFQARENLLTVAAPGAGDCVVPNVIPRLSRTPGSVSRPGPELGEHTVTVLRDLLGLEQSDIDALRSEGIV